ncbi:hypothetical protein BaRGS_00002911 [Batillaria attramentaria]|uniref:Uncharacterized protein n=1 Tax=Batillaria attramentaria TaxID=370345 RepID=A0ABD0M144_9CAEN
MGTGVGRLIFKNKGKCQPLCAWNRKWVARGGLGAEAEYKESLWAGDRSRKSGHWNSSSPPRAYSSTCAAIKIIRSVDISALPLGTEGISRELVDRYSSRL